MQKVSTKIKEIQWTHAQEAGAHSISSFYANHGFFLLD